MKKYLNRREAGKILADELAAYKERDDAIVLALPRGGVPVAYEIAKQLHLPLDVFIVRKLGVPGHEELAMGAMAANGKIIFNDPIIQDLQISPTAIQQVIAKEQKELARREKIYRGIRLFPELRAKTIILVDDGIATGATMRTAIAALRQHDPASIIMAVPVAHAVICQDMASLVDKLVCPLQPRELDAVGAWYDNFDQTTDEEVRTWLANVSGNC